jgi:ribokinase
MSSATIYGASALHVLCSAEPTAELTFGRVELSVGGPAAVVACQLALLGHQPLFVGTVGVDPPGDFIRAELNRYGIGGSAVIECARTPRVLAMVGAGSVKLTGDVDAEQILPSPERWLDAGRVHSIRTGWHPDEPSYATGFPELTPVIKALGDKGARLVVDVGYIPLLSDPPKLVEHVLSISHAIGVGVVSGQPMSPRDRKRLADVILDGGAETVLTTLGENGVVVSTRDCTEHLPAFRAVAADSLCAGDTFVAGFLSGVMEGRDVVSAARFGQAVAAAKVSIFGGLPTRDDAETLMAAQRKEAL